MDTTAAWTKEGDQANGWFGFSVGTAGDVNGDGYDDVIAGAPTAGGGGGRVYVYYGSAAGLSTTADWIAGTDETDSYLGRSVGTAGDVNGDGYDDVIVGASLLDGDQVDDGQAFVYHGAIVGLSSTAAWTAEGDLNYAQFGYSVGTAGDVNAARSCLFFSFRSPCPPPCLCTSAVKALEQKLPPQAHRLIGDAH